MSNQDIYFSLLDHINCSRIVNCTYFCFFTSVNCFITMPKTWHSPIPVYAHCICLYGRFVFSFLFYLRARAFNLGKFRTRNKPFILSGLGCRPDHLTSYFKVLLWLSVSNEKSIIQPDTILRRKWPGLPPSGYISLSLLDGSIVYPALNNI